MTAGVLVVGASQAGVQVAVSLRDLGYDGPITLAGAELHPPYQRPPLSKAYLKDATAALDLRDPAFYASRRIDLLTGERITGFADRGVARTDRGHLLAFDRLALTVGARPRRLTVPGAGLDGVRYLRDRDDAEALRGHLASARRVVVVGGGFIGLEIAAAARSRGCEVTVLEAAPRLMGRAVDPVISAFYLRAHTRRGVSVVLDARLALIEGDSHVTGVRLADGTRLPADLVVAGVGVVPRTELASELGLLVDGGIVVDARARTSDPEVVAAGDCTVQPNPLTGAGRIRIESMPNAIAQGRAAAATLAGAPSPAADVPWFWSDQYDLKLQIAGVADGHDQVVVRGDPDGESFSALYYRDGELQAVNAVNRAADYLVVRRALTGRIPLPADLAARADVPLKELLAVSAR
ncbi:NAD(P)/FAD-dependent oxidoreductase [Herbidospora sp. RD11066]